MADSTVFQVKSVPAEAVSSFIADLQKDGYTIYQLDPVFGASDFFSMVRERLPLDPPLSGRVNWNAFTDSLWNGIDSSGSAKNAIIWHNPRRMADNEPDAYREAVECLHDVISDFRKEYSLGRTNVTHLAIVLVEEV
jgi:hypothetical protein